MSDRENDFQNRSGQSRAQDSEGRQVQQELERQLRELGDTMSDAFRHGFEGRGMEIGDRAYERKIAGYTAPEAILTGLETRTSSPVRLKREEDFECAQLVGLYPCGEGAGYAGGIMSAAVDGLRVARAIISRYSPAEG